MKLIYKTLIILVTALICQACVTDDEPTGFSLVVGDSLPSFSVKLYSGETVSNKTLRGSVAVIIFFNTACPDCRQEFPVIQKVYDTISENPEVNLFGISRNETSASILQYWEANSLTFPWSPQPNREVYNLFADKGIPLIFIADKKGVITAIFGDKDMPDDSLILTTIEETLQSTLN